MNTPEINVTQSNWKNQNTAEVYHIKKKTIHFEYRAVTITSEHIT